MKNNLLLLLLLFSTGYLACKNQAPAETKAKSEIAMNPVLLDRQSASLMPDTFRMIVSLISHGGGTDPLAYGKLDSTLRAYQSTNGQSLRVYALPWGREGEVDYCWPLSELNPKEQMQLVDIVRFVFKDTQLVQISEQQRNRFSRP